MNVEVEKNTRHTDAHHFLPTVYSAGTKSTRRGTTSWIKNIITLFSRSHWPETSIVKTLAEMLTISAA